jgi:hypothetical protein
MILLDYLMALLQQQGYLALKCDRLFNYVASSAEVMWRMTEQSRVVSLVELGTCYVLCFWKWEENYE